VSSNLTVPTIFLLKFSPSKALRRLACWLLDSGKTQFQLGGKTSTSGHKAGPKPPQHRQGHLPGRFRRRRHAFAWMDNHGAASTKAATAASSEALKRRRSILQRQHAHNPRILSTPGKRGFWDDPYKEMRCRVSQDPVAIPKKGAVGSGTNDALGPVAWLCSAVAIHPESRAVL
jgi:hypothetical protein